MTITRSLDLSCIILAGTMAGNSAFAARLTFFLLDPHPKMPDMALSRAEAADLAAYIATLR